MILKKKELAASALKVGKERIKFVRSRLEEIKEAITKQDIRDLAQAGAIVIKPVKGRKANVKRKNRRGVGKVRRKVKKRKEEYVTITRKLRTHVKNLQREGTLSREEVKKLRKEIRNRTFKSKANLKQYVEDMKK